MTCMLEVTLASIQVSTRGTVLRVMLARRVVSLSKAVAHSSSIYASQRQKQQVSHLWFDWQGSTSKRFSSKSPIDRFKQSVTVTERERARENGSGRLQARRQGSVEILYVARGYFYLFNVGLAA